jgi:hypothetical protein
MHIMHRAGKDTIGFYSGINNARCWPGRSEKNTARRELVSVTAALPVDTPTQAEQPPLENEPPHRALKHAKLTEELRELRANWAKRNIQAQQTRIASSTPEITHVEKRRRELHLALEATQSEMGRLNKLLREQRQAGKPLRGDAAQPKRRPLGEIQSFLLISCSRPRTSWRRLSTHKSNELPRQCFGTARKCVRPNHSKLPFSDALFRASSINRDLIS